MTIKLMNLHGSPYLGIFCSVTDEVALIPEFVEDKERKRIADTLGVDVIALRLSDSHLLGVLSRGLGKKFVLANCVNPEDVQTLQDAGIEVLVLEDTSAIGNLLSVNAEGGVISPSVPEHERKKIEAFFGVSIHPMKVAKSDLMGSCLVVGNKGFLVHPKAEPEEMQAIENVLKVHGMRTTANYGDPFIGNSILTNKHGTMVGELTSGPELTRIDEGLQPGLLKQ